MVTSGDLPINISWTFNQLNIPPESGINTVSINRRANALSIESVTETHAGNYTCTAHNMAGMNSFTAHLHVNGLKFILSFGLCWCSYRIYFNFLHLVFFLISPWLSWLNFNPFLIKITKLLFSIFICAV